jgi:hypothetical protein
MRRFLIAICGVLTLAMHAGPADAAAAEQPPPKVAPAPPRQEGHGP